MARAGGDAGQGLLVGRRRVPERHAMPGSDQRLGQVEAAVELDGHGDDADVAAMRLDHPQDVGAGEAASRCTGIGHGQTIRPDARRPAQAVERLRAPEVGVDEIALEMRRQHARVRPGRAAGPPHALDQPLEDRGEQATVVGQNAVTP